VQIVQLNVNAAVSDLIEFNVELAKEKSKKTYKKQKAGKMMFLLVEKMSEVLHHTYTTLITLHSSHYTRRYCTRHRVNLVVTWARVAVQLVG
jgi:hypothetical protein